jgi:hypothetical protein
MGICNLSQVPQCHVDFVVFGTKEMPLGLSLSNIKPHDLSMSDIKPPAKLGRSTRTHHSVFGPIMLVNKRQCSDYSCMVHFEKFFSATVSIALWFLNRIPENILGDHSHQFLGFLEAFT